MEHQFKEHREISEIIYPYYNIYLSYNIYHRFDRKRSLERRNVALRFRFIFPPRFNHFRFTNHLFENTRYNSTVYTIRAYTCTGVHTPDQVRVDGRRYVPPSTAHTALASIFSVFLATLISVARSIEKTTRGSLDLDDPGGAIFEEIDRSAKKNGSTNVFQPRFAADGSVKSISPSIPKATRSRPPFVRIVLTFRRIRSRDRNRLTRNRARFLPHWTISSSR